MNKTAKTTSQQGDILLTKINDFAYTDKMKITAKNRCILAEGEKSGHCHVIEDDEAELIQDGERVLLSLQKQATLRHQEHNPITLEPGIWEVGKVNEYDYFSQMVRKVQD